ncbi:MAG: hypothetical protein HQL67_03580 [Magnetococcales bacterium]|nr:hypothetical protein [Magnetococcales bacterium]
MIVRIAIVLIIVFALVSWYLRKKQIKIGLTPMGKRVGIHILQRVLRLLLSKIGL